MMGKENLLRFHKAQGGKVPGLPSFSKAQQEISDGHKKSHWIWYVLPQLGALGQSKNAKYYGIQDFAEACDYLRDTTLFAHYNSMVEKIAQHLPKKKATTLMGSGIDASKLSSSITLFSAVAEHLASLETESSEHYQRLIQNCAQISSLLKQQGIPPCKGTLSILKVKPTEEQPKAPIPKEITISPKRVPKPNVEPSKLVPELALPETNLVDHQALSKNLEQYINLRSKEWEFHYNFLGFVSVFYFIQDWIFGTDHFNSKSREIKLSAAQKLKGMVEDDPSVAPLTKAEAKALKEGRLGDIVNEHGGLETVLEPTVKPPKSTHRL